MVNIRILGGPFPKQEKCSIELDAARTAYGDVFRLVQQQWQNHSHNIAQDVVVSASTFQLVELEESGQGSSGRPMMRVVGPVPLEQTLQTHPLTVPVLMLKVISAPPILSQHRKSVSFRESGVSSTPRARVIGGPILSSDRVFVEDTRSSRSSVMLVSDLFTQIAAHLPNSVHPPVHWDYYELYEATVSNSATGACDMSTQLQPMEPVDLQKLKQPLLMLKAKKAPTDQHQIDGTNTSPALLAGSASSAAWSPSFVPGRRSSFDADRHATLMVSPSLFSMPSVEMTSSIALHSPETVSIVHPPSAVVGTNASPKSETSISPSRRSSSFFRTVANAMLGARRASSLLGEEDADIDDTSVTFASSTATTTAASATVPSSSTPSPARSSLTAASPIHIQPHDAMATNSFLTSVTFTLNITIVRRDTASTFESGRWTDPKAEVGILVEKVLQVVVTPHMTLEAIASVATTQTGGQLHLSDAKWFRSEESAKVWLAENSNASSKLLLKQTECCLALALHEPKLTVLCPSSNEEEEGFPDAFVHNSSILDKQDSVSVPSTLQQRRASSVKLPSTTHAAVRAVVHFAEDQLPQLGYHEQVILQRQLNVVLQRKDSPFAGPMFLDSLLRTWQRAFDPAQLDPDATDRARTTVERRAVKVLSILDDNSQGRDVFPAHAAEGSIVAHTISHVATALSARQVIRTELVDVVYRQEPAARFQLLSDETVLYRERLYFKFVNASERCGRQSIDVKCLMSREHNKRVALAARAFSALMSRASSIFALWLHLTEEKERRTFCVLELQARQCADYAAILREEDTLSGCMYTDAKRVGAELGYDHFIQSTQVAHFHQEAQERNALEQQAVYTISSSMIYFQQFCERKAVLAQNDIWYASMEMLCDRVEGEHFDIIPSYVTPFYRLAWGQRYDLLIAHESSARLVIKQQSEDLYGSICRRFLEWIDERNSLSDQLSRMELSKVERIARVRIQDQQQMSLETLHYVIQDSFLYHWHRHQERLAVSHKETFKRERWEAINRNLRDVWYQLKHVLVQEAASQRHIIKLEHERAEYLMFLKLEITARVAILDEEWTERISMQKLYMEVAFQRHRASERIMISSHRVLIEDEEERGRRDLIEDAFQPYTCWSQCLMTSHGEATYRSLIVAEQMTACSRLQLLDGEIRRRRGIEHTRRAIMSTWKEQFLGAALELKIADERQHYRQQVQTFTLLVRISPLYVPSGVVTLNVSRAATAEAVLGLVRAAVPQTKYYNFDKEAFSIVTHGATNVLLPRDVVWPSLAASDKAAKKSVDLMSGEQVTAMSAKLSHRAARAISPVLSETSEPESSVAPVHHPVVVRDKTAHHGPAVPVLPSEQVRREKAQPKQKSANAPRVRSPPRKASLPEEARRKSMSVKHDTSAEFDSEDPANTKFTFRIYCPGVSSGHTAVTLLASSEFTELLPVIQSLRPDVRCFDDVLVFPAVVLSGKVTPSGKPVGEHDTVQRSGLFGGGLLVLRKNRNAPPQQQPARAHLDQGADRGDGGRQNVHQGQRQSSYPPASSRGGSEEYIPLLPDANRWNIEEDFVVSHESHSAAFILAEKTIEVVGDVEAPLSVDDMVAHDHIAPLNVQTTALNNNSSGVAPPPRPAFTSEATHVPDRPHPLVNVASSSAISSAYASPRTAVNISQASTTSMMSLPELSASPVPIRFERPVTPVFDSPRGDGVFSTGPTMNYPTLQSFGVSDVYVAPAVASKTTAITVAPNPQLLSPNSMAVDGGQVLSAPLAPVAKVATPSRTVAPEPQEHSNAVDEPQVPASQVEGRATAQPPAALDIVALVEPPTRAAVESTPPRAARSVTIVEPPAVLPAPQEEASVAAVVKATSPPLVPAITCTVLGGPIPPDASLTFTVLDSSRVEELFEIVCGHFSWDEHQQGAWLMCQVVLSGTQSPKPALRACRAGLLLRDCASRTFALRAKATKRLQIEPQTKETVPPSTSSAPLEVPVAEVPPAVSTLSVIPQQVCALVPPNDSTHGDQKELTVLPLKTTATTPLAERAVPPAQRSVSPTSIMLSPPQGRSVSPFAVSPTRQRTSPVRSVGFTQQLDDHFSGTTPGPSMVSPPTAAALSVSPVDSHLGIRVSPVNVAPQSSAIVTPLVRRALSPKETHMSPAVAGMQPSFFVSPTKAPLKPGLHVSVRVLYNGHHFVVDDVRVSATMQDVLGLAAEFFNRVELSVPLQRSLVIKDGVHQILSGQSKTLSRSDSVASLLPLVEQDEGSPRIILFEKRQASFSAGTMDEELFDVSDLPQCTLMIRHSDDGPMTPCSGLVLRPSIDTAFRSILKLISEERRHHTPYDTRLVQIFAQQHTSPKELFDLDRASVIMQRLQHASSSHGNSGGSVFVDDVDESPMQLLQLSPHRPSFLSLFIILPAPKVIVPAQPQPTPAPVSVTPPRRQSMFDRLRSAILGSPTTDAPPQEPIPNSQSVSLGFDYGQKDHATDQQQAEPSPKRADPISLRVLGGPIPPTTKVVISMMSSETVMSIFAHCRNRLIEFGLPELALQCSDEQFTVHYVRRQLGQQRASADKDPMQPDASLMECGVERSSHVVTLRKRPPKMGDIVFDAMKSPSEAPVTTKEVSRRVRIVGGPVPKEARVYLPLPDANLLYRSWFPLIQTAIAAAITLPGDGVVSAETHLLIEMEIPEGGGVVKQRRELPLDDTFEVSPMFSLVVALRKKKAPPPQGLISPSFQSSSISIGDALDLVEVLPLAASPSGSPKSVRWDDQSPKPEDHRTIRVRVIAPIIPPKVKVFVTLGAWMSFGSVFRLVSEQLTTAGLAFPGDQFSEDYYSITAMKLDALSQLLVVDKNISPLDDVKDALDVKVLMLALTSAATDDQGAPLQSSASSSSLKKVPTELLTRSSSFNASSLQSMSSATGVSSVASSSLRTSRTVPIRIVGVTGVPSTCKIVIQASMSSKITQLFSLITDAVRKAEGVDKNAVRYFDCHPKTHQLIEVEVAENGSHRRKQTLDLGSTLFLCDFAAPMSLIRVERLLSSPDSFADDNVDLSGSVDVFTPKRTQERQHRRTSLEGAMYRLPDAIRTLTTVTTPPSALHAKSHQAPLDLDNVQLDRADDLQFHPQLSDPFSVDIDTQRYDSPPLARKGSGVWEKGSPDVTPRAAAQGTSNKPVSTSVESLPSLQHQLTPSQQHGLISPIKTVVAEMPFAVPTFSGDDSEFEGMHVEVASDVEEGDDEPLGLMNFSTVAPAEYSRNKMDSSVTTPVPQKASTTSSSSTASSAAAAPTAGRLLKGQARYDVDVDVFNVSHDGHVQEDRHDEGSPKHNNFHRAVGSPYGSFRKHRLGAGGLDASFDSSPRRSGSRESKTRVDVVEVAPISALEPVHAHVKPRSPDVLLLDDDEDSIRLFQTNIALRGQRKGGPRGSLAGAQDLEEQRRVLSKLEHDLQMNSLPHLRTVGASKSPMVSGPAQKQKHQQRGRSVDDGHSEPSPFLPPLARSVDYSRSAPAFENDRNAFSTKR
ncbi:Hypothetical protein, putative [Bodo saltans]|uniref:Uncharacterized protein n=1 Tax=Bodo saltans TaxID=75058 RepID=A0A0S4J6E4_BODSA|nr:Hypothetical protein, putative [Bodo saltans]|eukprot:CUG85435.1 Hypothetical protein, putative [Bodo saltans]